MFIQMKMPVKKRSLFLRRFAKARRNNSQRNAHYFFDRLSKHEEIMFIQIKMLVKKRSHYFFDGLLKHEEIICNSFGEFTTTLRQFLLRDLRF